MIKAISIHSTARVETYLDGFLEDEEDEDFNPLHREGGDTYYDLYGGRGSAFQSTPPRGWRLLTAKYEFVLLHISIHSTARVETGYSKISLYCANNFNPLHREGGDPALPAHTQPDGGISIHSTARVETVNGIGPHRRSGDFNPLHREGGDETTVPILITGSIFQSTPPRGWRRTRRSLKPIIYQISIHSTARVETHWSGKFDVSESISIHSTARVETEQILYRVPADPISIHSTARVETPDVSEEAGEVYDFNPLHREGGDSLVRHGVDAVPNFNPLHREGGDHIGCDRVVEGYVFQSTPPRGWRRSTW